MTQPLYDERVGRTGVAAFTHRWDYSFATWTRRSVSPSSNIGSPICS